jgi:hypothetical protein
MLSYIWNAVLGLKKRDQPHAWEFPNMQLRIKNRWRNLNEMRRERMLNRVGLDTEARKKEYSSAGGGRAVEVITYFLVEQNKNIASLERFK